MEKGKREGEELRSEVHMCLILMFLRMITFFHHPDISHVARELGPAACVEDLVNVWRM